MAGGNPGRGPDGGGLRAYLLLIGALVAVVAVGGGFIWVLHPADGRSFVASFVVMVGLAVALVLAGGLIAREMRARVAADRRTAESAAELSASRRRFQQILDYSPVEISFVAPDGKFVAISRATEMLWKMTSAEARGKTVYDLLPREEADLLRALDAEALRTRAPIQREVSLTTPLGQRTFLVVRFPLVDAAGAVEAIGAIAADVTSQHNAEQALVRMQRMEAIGKLTGGFAHDFNNLLTVILGNAEQIAERSQGADREQAEIIVEAADRGADLTGRLLAFARRQTLEPRVTDVNALVRGMEPLLRRTLGEHILIEITTAENLRKASIDPAQLEIAIVNLVANSGEAMQPGGRLTIETANADLDEAYALANAEVKPGPYVMIAVGDTGTGMPPEVLTRAFERIYSEVGMGTIVRLYLPVAQPAGEARSPVAAEPALSGGNESILIVEDDPQVRANLERQLGELGYRVRAAEHGAAAIGMIGEAFMPDLLITDMVMPGGMNGAQLADALHKRFPTLKVLFLSGYAHGVAPAPLNGISKDRHFLGKPFRRRDLATRVRSVLDGAQPPA